MRNGLLVPLVFGIAGVAILLVLGEWQLRRLAEKQSELAQIDAKAFGTPIRLPEAPDPKKDKYRHVQVSGQVLPGEIHVLTSDKSQGPGFRIIVPLDVGGRVILLDRGYVPETNKDGPRPAVVLALTGHLLWPDDETDYTPEPDLVRNIWFSRNVTRMAEHLDAHPILVVAATASDSSPGAPMPVRAGHNIPNDHLEYAITWFSLAAIWASMTGYFVWRRLASRP